MHCTRVSLRLIFSVKASNMKQTRETKQSTYYKSHRAIYHTHMCVYVQIQPQILDCFTTQLALAHLHTCIRVVLEGAFSHIRITF